MNSSESSTGLGETFVSGRLVNLDKAELSDLEKNLSDVGKEKENAKKGLSKLIEEIKNI